MPVKQFDGRIGSRPHNRVRAGERFSKTRKGFCHFWMGRLEMLLPFCSKPNRPIMDVVEKLHGYIYALLTPNAAGEQRPTLDETRTDPKSLSGGPSAPVACSVQDVPSSIV